MNSSNDWGETVRQFWQVGLLVIAAFLVGYLFALVRNPNSNPTGSNTVNTNNNAGQANPGAPAGQSVTLASILDEVTSDPDQVMNCLENGQFTDKVDQQTNEGSAAGVTGTPGSFVMIDGSQGEALGGAVPYESLKTIIDQYLAEGSTSKTETLDSLPPLSDSDHVRGNSSARVVVIEYSDFDCPFCSRFHNTMNQIMDEYGDQVAWVYRHFPIPNLHPNAPKLAEVSECVTQVDGEDGFWSFSDKYFEVKGQGAQVTL